MTRFVIHIALVATLLLGGALASHANPASSVFDTKRLMRYDALAFSSRNVSRVALFSPGDYSREVMAIFKMRLGRFFPEPFGLSRERFRPYLLGGRASLRVPTGRTLGERVPGEDAFAMHIGGGAEVKLRERLFLSMDVGEVLHSGPLDEQSYQTYKVGLVYDF